MKLHVDIVIVIVYWPYCHLVFVMGKKLINEHFLSWSSLTKLTLDSGKYQKQNIKKKGYDQARGRTRENLGAAFQWWRELKEQKGLEADAEVALFLFDRWVMLILLCFTQLIRVGFCLNMLVCHLHLFPRSSLPWLCMYMWGGYFKIRARSCWAMGVFVLVLSNINIVWQKSLSAPLSKYFLIILLFIFLWKAKVFGLRPSVSFCSAWAKNFHFGASLHTTV